LGSGWAIEALKSPLENKVCLQQLPLSAASASYGYILPDNSKDTCPSGIDRFAEFHLRITKDRNKIDGTDMGEKPRDSRQTTAALEAPRRPPSGASTDLCQRQISDNMKFADIGNPESTIGVAQSLIYY